MSKVIAKSYKRGKKVIWYHTSKTFLQDRLILYSKHKTLGMTENLIIYDEEKLQNYQENYWLCSHIASATFKHFPIPRFGNG